MHEGTCLICGTPFKTIKPNKLYCSKLCKKRAEDIRRRLTKVKATPNKPQTTRDRGGRVWYLTLAQTLAFNEPPHKEEEELYYAPHEPIVMYSKPKAKPKKKKRTYAENDAIILDTSRKARELGLDYGEYTACVRQGIDPATRAQPTKKPRSYDERAWLEHIFSITGKI